MTTPRSAPSPSRAREIEQQVEFVQWWRDSIRGKGKKANNDDPGYFVEDAEKLTGISQQQVSKWAKRLQEHATSRHHAAFARPGG